MTFQIQKFADPGEALSALLPEWEALDEQMSPRTPYSSPIWFQEWWKHLRRQSLFNRDEFFLHTVRDKRGQLVAVAPFIKTCRPAFGPLKLRILQFIGADPSITELRGLICRTQDQDAVVHCLVEHFSSIPNEWDLLLWRGFRESALSPGLQKRLGGLNADDALPCYVLELPGSWDQLIGTVSSNTRKSIRKSYEFLERDGHKFCFRIQEQPEKVSEALEIFFSLHAARSAAPDMKIHRDRLTGYKDRTDIVADFARKMSERGSLKMLQLEIKDEIVATRIAFLLGSDLYLYYSGFDPNWRRYGVMTTLMAETMKWAIANGIERVNLSTGTDSGKTRWRPHEIRYYNKIQVSPTLRGKLAFYIHESINQRPSVTQPA
jgi:CelD/BcsL family acetyltransferase involved in cellulose biosynthesis